MSTKVSVKPGAAESDRTGPGSTIRVVSIRTGLPMDTLRAWERRYGFPKPQRRPGSNRRLYAEADVERLVAMARTIDRGYRIGDVVGMPLRELIRLAAENENAARLPSHPADVEGLLDRLARDDVAALESELRTAAATLGAKRFITEVAHPFVVRVGESWVEGRLAVRHEHVATECLTTQLRHMLAAYQDVKARPHVLLATLPGEPHTLALQMVALYLAVHGAKPRLLGASLPGEQLAQAATTLAADVVGLTVTPVSDLAATRRAIQALAKRLRPDVPIWVGGGAAASLGAAAPVRLVATWEALDDALAQWRGKGERG